MGSGSARGPVRDRPTRRRRQRRRVPDVGRSTARRARRVLVDRRGRAGPRWDEHSVLRAIRACSTSATSGTGSARRHEAAAWRRGPWARCSRTRPVSGSTPWSPSAARTTPARSGRSSTTTRCSYATELHEGTRLRRYAISRSHKTSGVALAPPPPSPRPRARDRVARAICQDRDSDHGGTDDTGDPRARDSDQWLRGLGTTPRRRPARHRHSCSPAAGSGAGRSPM